jgi:HlyD family secretion protein
MPNDATESASPVRDSDSGEHAPPSSAIRKNLELGRSSRWRKWLVRMAIFAVLGAAVAAFVVWRARAQEDAAPRYMTEPMQRGDLKVTVTATGNIKGRDTVEVGAEISGRVVAVHVDYNSPVKKDQVLAEIDTEPLKANIEQATAQVSSARAQVVSAEATAKEAKLQAARARDMAAKGLVSQQQLETAEATAERAQAAVGAARAQATVAAATLKEASTSAGKALIKSPIDGVVLGRHVEVGQTVAASLQVAVLFTLARDLKQMVLSVDVDEADIGRVAENQQATFTVDAFPNKRFKARVESLRNMPKTDASAAAKEVVTYEAVLAVKNDDLLLRPGMTATATIVTSERKNVPLLPNAALRFTPPEMLSKDGPNLRLPGMRGLGGGGRPRGGASAAPSASASPGERGERGERGQRERVWKLQDNKPVAVSVRTGSTDGRFTELLDGELEVGTELLVDLAGTEP